MNAYKYELLHLKEISQGFLEMNAGFRFLLEMLYGTE